MPLILSSEAQMVRDTAHEFFKERAPITALRKLRDTNDPEGFSRGLWREMAELGWTGFLVPEDHGGTEFGVLGLAQVMEASGRTLTASPLVSTALVGASFLAMAGSEAQKAEHLPPLVAGERLFAFALEEGSRHQPYRIAAKAEKQGGGYALSGKKVFVLDGHIADVLIVAARTTGEPGDRDGITLFLVPGDVPGVSRQRTIMIDSRNAAQMFCEVEVTRSAVIAACSALDENTNDAAALAVLAKGKANDTLDLCGNEGVQMHGGIGMTDEHEIGFFMKRARVARATFGETAFCQDRYAALLGY